MHRPVHLSIRAPLLSASILGAFLLGAPGRAHGAVDFSAEVAQRESCAREDLLCLDDHGRGYAGDDLAAQLPAGAAITVKVLGCPAENTDIEIKLEDSVTRSPDRLFRESTESDPTRDAAPQAKCADAKDITVLKSGRFVVSTDIAVQRYTIAVSRVRQAGSADAALEAVEHYTTAVAHGRYFLDVGVLIPVVIGGEREVVADDTDQPNVKRLRIRNDVDVFPALMLHVFPGGREFGALSSFSRGASCGPGRLDPSGCRASRHRRRAANSLGVQAGVELDFKKFSRVFLGGLFEPVSGFSVNAGVALTRLQYIRGGYYEGAVIPATNVVHADGTPDLSRYVEQRWAPRFYLGITLSLDILRYLGERRRRDELGSLLTK